MGSSTSTRLMLLVLELVVVVVVRPWYYIACTLLKWSGSTHPATKHPWSQKQWEVAEMVNVLLDASYLLGGSNSQSTSAALFERVVNIAAASFDPLDHKRQRKD